MHRPASTAALLLAALLMLGALLSGALVPHADGPEMRTVEFSRVKPDGSPVDRPYRPEE